MRKSLLILVLSIIGTTVFAQSRTITGTIKDGITGEALIGASIRSVSDPSVGALTDIDGNFFLEVDDNTTEVVASYVGYENMVIVLSNNQSEYFFELVNSNELKSVVVTTYGKDGQTPVPGAIAIVEAERIENVPIASFEQILQGQAPGLTVLSGSGQPGTAATVRIRGASSIQGGTDPLYILDGIQIEPSEFASLNPNDFEVAAVLKDAASTAQYGSRAANGVIVLKTKQGVQGKTQIRYTGQYGFSEPGRQRFDMMNSTELLAFQEIAGRGAGWSLSPNNPANQGISADQLEANAEELARLRANDNDLRDLFFRQGQTQTHDISFRGGSATTRFYASLGLYDEEAIAIRSNLDRKTARLNLDHDINDNARISFKGSIGDSKSNFIESENGIALANGFAAVYLGNPFETILDDNGNILYQGNDPEGINQFAGYTAANAYARLLQDTNGRTEFKGIGSIDFEYDFLNDMFTAGVLAGVDYRTRDTQRFQDPDGYGGNLVTIGGGEGSITQTDTKVRSFTVTPTLNFQNQFSDKHYVNAVAGFEYIDREFELDSFTGYGINNLFPFPVSPDAAQFVDPDTGLQTATFSGRETRNLLASGFFNGTYVFDDRYEIGGGVRRDASSRFGDNFREATFYSLGAKWIVDQEPFMANADNVDLLRVRASIGTSGNQEFFGGNITSDANNFFFAPTLGSGTNIANQFLTINRLPNPDLKWEVKESINLGADFEFFSRLRGSLDVYRETSSDLLIQRAISGTTGQYTIPLFNAGEMRNQGVELEINGEVLQSGKFSWNLGANLAYNENEILDLGGESEFASGTSIIRVGEELGAHFIEPWAGVDPATGDPLYFTPDGEITNNFNLVDPQTGWGSFIPPWVGGFDSTLSFGDLSVFTQFNFAADYNRFNNQTFFQENPNFAQFNLSNIMNTIWQEPGDVTEVQRIGTARQFSSKDIEKADFLRFRNLRVSYNVPGNLTKSTNVLSNANIFMNATNIYTWTQFTGFDPEDSNNIAGYEYPLPRQVTFGINLGL